MAITETINCEQCGKAHTYKRSTKPKRFCSPSCSLSKKGKGEGYKPKTIKDNCAHCGNEFQRFWRGCGVRPTLCSARCKRAAWDLRHKDHVRLTKERYVAIRSELSSLRRIARARHRSLIEIKAKRFAWLVDYHKRATHSCEGCGVPLPGDDMRAKNCGDCAKERERKRKRAHKSLRRARVRVANVYGEAIDPIEVLNAYHWQCYICRCETPQILRGTVDDSAPELDHIVPLSKGGLHVRENLACACRRCNQLKADKSFTEAINLRFPGLYLPEVRLGVGQS